MRLLPITVAALSAAVCFAPLAEAAPKKGKSSRSAKTTQSKKRDTKKTTEQKEQKQEKKEDPAQQPEQAKENQEAYDRFIAALNEQVKANRLDYCPALEIVLQATQDEFAAEEWMKRASDGGNAAAQCYVAGRTLTNVPADRLRAEETVAAYQLVRKAADSGFVPAAVDVSICLKHGIGTDKNEAESNRMLMQACRSGNFDSRFKWLQLSGRLEKFDDKDRPEVKSEIDRGNHHILYYLSAFAPDSATQVEWLRKAAEKGNGEALFALSSISSRVKPKDSYTLLKEAVKQHSPAAMFVLGTAMTDPDPTNVFTTEAGITKDEKAGLHLVRLASMVGNSQADMALGHAYYDGTFGHTRSAERAFRHYENAAKARNVAGAAAAGYLLLKGEGTKQDIHKGTNLLNLAANAGYGHAAILLAHAKFAGLGCTPDAAKAEEYLNDAAIMKMPVAYVYLAYITAKGCGDRKPDEKLAENYVRMASLDMGDKAKEIYDKLMAEGKWEPHP